jgi:nucleolar protein 56
MYVLYESAAGYALFLVEEFEKIAQRKDDVQAAVLDMSKFGSMVKFNAILPFASAETALQNINDISEVRIAFLQPYDVFTCGLD